MCGIAGAFSLVPVQAAVSRMSERLRHRGPDDCGETLLLDAAERRVGAFALRRLAIQDVSSAGHQPMESADGRFVIVYNGEIYNFRELRAVLEREGVVFRSGTDTEVILHGVARHGTAFLNRLRGMFAFAFWDRAKATGLLVRDPFGIKPLYYACSDDGVFFASEVRAILAAGNVAPVLSREAVNSYLAYGSVSEPRSIVEGIFALPPGTVAEIAVSERGVRMLAPAPFAGDPLAPTQAVIDDTAQAAAHVRSALRDAVAHHLVSDVPVALFLSGGIDSTAVAALAGEVTTERLDSFTITFEEREFNEREIARTVANRFGLRHHEIPLSGQDLLRMLPDAFAAMDQPSMDGLNTFAISRAVRASGMKVVLSGLGGDELFAGYPSFRRARATSLLHHAPAIVRRAARSLGRFTSVANREKVHLLFEGDDPALSAYRASRMLFGADQLRDLTGELIPSDPPAAPHGLSVLQRVSWHEATGYMLNTLLRDSDVFSMAQGLELRVPFIDRVVAAAAVSVPDAIKLRMGQSKPLLVDAVRDLIPLEVWDRPKQGFALPFQQWLRRDLKAEVDATFTRRAFERVGVNVRSADEIWRGYTENRGVRWSRPWALYTLIRWAEQNDAAIAELPLARRHRVSSTPQTVRPVPAAAPSPAKIHLWAPDVFDFKGGIQVYQLDLLRSIGEVSPLSRLSVFVKNDAGMLPLPAEFNRIEFRYAGKTHRRIRTPRFVSQILSSGLRERPDLVIVGHLNFAAIAHTLNRLAGVPYWIIAYGIEAWDVRKPALRRALQNAELILSISEHTRARLLATQELDPRRVVLLPPTFDANSFYPGPKPVRLLERYRLRADQPVILTVARLAGAERYKGYDQILESLPAVQRHFPDVRYVLVGQGDDRARIDARIRELGLGDAVTMAGFVPDAELRDHYNLCDVFAMPSKREGFGIVYVESAACGKPALGGNQDGAVDALSGGKFGVLVDPDNVGEIAGALNNLLARQYPAPLLYHPEQLRTAVIEQFGIDRFRELLQSYLATVPGRAAARPA